MQSKLNRYVYKIVFLMIRKIIFMSYIFPSGPFYGCCLHLLYLKNMMNNHRYAIIDLQFYEPIPPKHALKYEHIHTHLHTFRYKNTYTLTQLNNINFLTAGPLNRELRNHRIHIVENSTIKYSLFAAACCPRRTRRNALR